MHKALAFLLHELREAALPAAFFFVAFLVGAITKALVLESYGLTPTGVVVSVVGALIVAKAVLIADHLPLMHRFDGRPLIVSVLWKAAIYWLLCLAFRVLEELVPLWSKHGGLGAAIQHMDDEISWPLVAAVQLWLVVALLLYSALRELDRHFGRGSLRRAMLSPGRAEAPHRKELQQH
jgi:hypothetical protein